MIPPIEWLLDVSENTLMELQMAAWNRSAKHLKAAKAEWQASVTEATTAELAQYLRDNREAILAHARKSIETQSVLTFPERKRA